MSHLSAHIGLDDYFNSFKATVLLKLFGVEASFLIDMEAFMVLRVSCPFCNGVYKVWCITVSQL